MLTQAGPLLLAEPPVCKAFQQKLKFQSTLTIDLICQRFSSVLEKLPLFPGFSSTECKRV